MKYPAPRVSQPLFAAVVLGILFGASAHSTFAETKQPSSGTNAEQRFSKSSAVPAGLGASDWAGIRAAHQAATQESHLTKSERGERRALAADPIAQEAYMKSSNSDAIDVFGGAVAISGDTVVVGAPGESSNATGVNGDQTNNSLLDAGAAYVFVRNGATWTQQAYLKASNTGQGDDFGRSVAISGDTIVVGADGEDSSAKGINGDQSDNSATGAGAAYVFVRTGTTWSQQAYLKSSNTDAVDTFGNSVAVSGETIVVGALGESSNATGINGDQSDNSALQAGAAYVFVRNGTTWSQQAYLKASNTDASDQFRSIGDHFGRDCGRWGARESSSATGVGGDQNDNTAPALVPSTFSCAMAPPGVSKHI